MDQEENLFKSFTGSEEKLYFFDVRSTKAGDIILTVTGKQKITHD